MNILEIKGLDVSFKSDVGEDLRAVRGVDLTLSKGEVLAIVGESGSGKSVTGKAILGILPRGAVVNGGEIIYGGRDILTLGERELEALRGGEISVVPQDPFLSLDPITKIGPQIAESVKLPDGLRGKEARLYRRRRAIELLREVGIVNAEERYGEYPFRLSGGMRQRVAIAAAIASAPRLLICDEPTTALDVTIEAQILDLLIRLKEERGLSMIFITHDLGVVARIADRVAVMYAGEIVETGRVEDVFYNPCHPYTWALFSSIPDGRERLSSIRGSVPDMRNPPRGDAFAYRSDYAVRIDFIIPPPIFEVEPGHTVKSWLYHPTASRPEMPKELALRIKRMREKRDEK